MVVVAAAVVGVGVGVVVVVCGRLDLGDDDLHASLVTQRATMRAIFNLRIVGGYSTAFSPLASNNSTATDYLWTGEKQKKKVGEQLRLKERTRERRSYGYTGRPRLLFPFP